MEQQADAAVRERDRRMLRLAAQLAKKSIESGGGPFGAVIARGDTVLAACSNSVVPSCDPTAHAEVSCIREACKATASHCLEGCTIYTTCEPCPMCLGAIYWAHLSRIVFASTREDAARAGFDDDFIYHEIDLPISERRVPTEHLPHAEAEEPLHVWSQKPDRAAY